MNSTRMNGFFNNPIACRVALELFPASAGFGGVCGSIRLTTDNSREAMPAATYT